jgi:hypothetical protein
MITTAPCSPAASGLPQEKIDKWRTSGMENKVEGFIDSFCSACPNRLAEFCEAQGSWTNLDGQRVFLDGIFGGYTQAERVERGVRHFDPVEG